MIGFRLFGIYFVSIYCMKIHPYYLLKCVFFLSVYNNGDQNSFAYLPIYQPTLVDDEENFVSLLSSIPLTFRLLSLVVCIYFDRKDKCSNPSSLIVNSQSPKHTTNQSLLSLYLPPAPTSNLPSATQACKKSANSGSP